jgi:hypothetical protein
VGIPVVRLWRAPEDPGDLEHDEIIAALLRSRRLAGIAFRSALQSM